MAQRGGTVEYFRGDARTVQFLDGSRPKSAFDARLDHALFGGLQRGICLGRQRDRFLHNGFGDSRNR